MPRCAIVNIPSAYFLLLDAAPQMTLRLKVLSNYSEFFGARYFFLRFLLSTRGGVNLTYTFRLFSCLFLSALVISIVMAPPLVHADEELMADINAPLLSTELLGDFNDKCERYVTDAGYFVGQNTKPDGGFFYIATGVATINSDVGGPNYASRRWVAYEKALLLAKQQTAEYLTVEVERQTSFDILSPQEQESLKANVSNEELKEIKHYEDTRDIDSAWKKSLELLNRDLDKKLAESEPKKDEPPAKSLEEVVQKHKELGSEVYKNTVAIESVHRLSGIRVFYIGDKSPKGGKGEICVAAIYSKKLKQIADAMATKDLSLMPETAPGEPIDSFIPDKNTNEGRLALVNKMGVDVRADDQGNFWLISYGQAGPAKEGSKMSQNRARRLAQLRALGALRAYIGENFISSGMGDVEEVSIEYESDIPDSDTLVENVASKAKSVMAEMNIQGVAKADEIGMRHPTSGNEMYIAVYKWSSSTLAGAKKMSRELNTKPKSRAASGASGNAPVKKKRPTTGYEGGASGGTKLNTF